jgi:hypothetical protein
MDFLQESRKRRLVCANSPAVFVFNSNRDLGSLDVGIATGSRSVV